MNTMTKIFAMLLLGTLLVLTGCNAIENLSNSGTRLILDSVEGFVLGEDGTEGTENTDFIQCDVLVQTTEDQILNASGSVFNTNAMVNLRAMPLNPRTVTDDLSHYNDVTIDRIDVSFQRTDGRNQPLVDVPLAFSVPVTQNIRSGSTASTPISFTLIRHTAKWESPLRDLRELGQEKILVLVARVTVYGIDGAGNRVEPVSGWIEVHCANYGNKAEEKKDEI